MGQGFYRDAQRMSVDINASVKGPRPNAATADAKSPDLKAALAAGTVTRTQTPATITTGQKRRR